MISFTYLITLFHYKSNNQSLYGRLRKIFYLKDSTFPCIHSYEYFKISFFTICVFICTEHSYKAVIIGCMYYFEIVIDLQKICKNSRVPIYASPISLNVITSVTIAQLSKVRNEHWDSNLYTLFNHRLDFVHASFFINILFLF